MSDSGAQRVVALLVAYFPLAYFSDETQAAYRDQLRGLDETIATAAVRELSTREDKPTIRLVREAYAKAAAAKRVADEEAARAAETTRRKLLPAPAVAPGTHKAKVTLCARVVFGLVVTKRIRPTDTECADQFWALMSLPPDEIADYATRLERYQAEEGRPFLGDVKAAAPPPATLDEYAERLEQEAGGSLGGYLATAEVDLDRLESEPPYEREPGEDG